MARSARNKDKPSAHEMVGRIKSTVDDPALVERRRTQITAAAITVFIRLGYHAATIRDVAKQAQVSIGLIYQYVGDKEDLLFLALVEILRAYERGIPPALEGIEDPLSRFCAVVRAYCNVHGITPDATALAYRETASLGKKRRDVIKQLEIETNRLIGDEIRTCIASGVFDENLDIELFCYQIVMFSHAWALKAWNFRSRMSIDSYLDRGLRLMLCGVLTTKGSRQYKAMVDSRA